MTTRTAPRRISGIETVALYQSANGSFAAGGSSADTVSLQGTYGNGSYALSSALYQSAGTSQSTNHEGAVVSQTLTASPAANDSLTVASDGLLGWGRAATETDNVGDAQTIADNSLATSALDTTRSENWKAYEFGAYAGGILSLSSAAYNNGGSSRQTFQRNSLATSNITDTSSTVSSAGSGNGAFFGAGQQALTGTLNATTQRLTSASEAATANGSWSSYYGGTYDGAQFSFGSYSHDQGDTSQSSAYLTVTTTASGTMHFSATQTSSWGLGRLPGHVPPPTVFGDSGSMTFHSLDTYASSETAATTFVIHEEGTLAGGRYNLPVYQYTSQSSRTGTQTDSASQSAVSTSGSETVMSTSATTVGSGANESSTLSEAGSWSVAGGYSLSSVLYRESGNSSGSNSGSALMTLVSSIPALATMTETDSGSSAATHSLYQAGSYSNNSFAFGSYTLDDTATSATDAVKTEQMANDPVNATVTGEDSTSWVDATHAEGTYGGGSFSFGTYRHDSTALTTHTLSAHGVYSLSYTQWENAYTQQGVHATGSGQSALATLTYASQLYQRDWMTGLATYTTSSTGTAAYSLAGAALGVIDPNMLGVGTAGGLTQPILRDIVNGNMGGLDWSPLGSIAPTEPTPESVGVDISTFIGALTKVDMSVTGAVAISATAGTQEVALAVRTANTVAALSVFAQKGGLIAVAPEAFGKGIAAPLLNQAKTLELIVDVETPKRPAVIDHASDVGAGQILYYPLGAGLAIGAVPAPINVKKGSGNFLYTNGAGLAAWKIRLSGKLEDGGAGIDFAFKKIADDRYVIYIPEDQRAAAAEYFRKTFPEPTDDFLVGHDPELRRKLWLNKLDRLLAGGTAGESLWLRADGAITPYTQKNADYQLAATNLAREMNGQAPKSFVKAEDFDGMTFSEYMRAYNEGFVIGTDKFIARIEKTGDSAVKIAKGSYKLGKYVINNPGDSLLRTVDGVAVGLEAVGEAAGEAIANPLETGKKIIDWGKNAIAGKAEKYEEDTSAALIDDGFSVLEFVIGGKLVGRLFGEAGAAEGAAAREAESQAVKEAEKQAAKAAAERLAAEAPAKGAPNAVNPKTRLPRTNGKWEGEPGNGKWHSDIPEVNAITGNKPIEFVNGRPVFSPWAKGRITFEKGKLTGTADDFDLVYQKIAELKGLPNKTAGKNWLRDRGLSPHHLDGTTIELIPSDLHGNIPHIGSASDLRGGY